MNIAKSALLPAGAGATCAQSFESNLPLNLIMVHGACPSARDLL